LTDFGDLESLENFPLPAFPTWMRVRREPREHLYHYTSMEGFHGIIGNQEIWATAHPFLNDSSERTHGHELFHQALVHVHRMIAQAGGPQPKIAPLLPDFKSALWAELSRRSNSNLVCMASFCETAEELNQYRLYPKTEDGVAIGFYPQILYDCLPRGWMLVKCCYDREPSELRTSVIDLVDHVETAYLAWLRTLGRKPTADDQSHAVTSLAKRAAEWADMISPAIKDNSFRREQEWRIVSPPLNEDHLQRRPITDQPYRAVHIDLPAPGVVLPGGLNNKLWVYVPGKDDARVAEVRSYLESHQVDHHVTSPSTSYKFMSGYHS
jgi:hypothetical protein